MIKKKSNVRKYSRKVKNKKVKYSKKLMSGGGNPTLSFTIPERPTLTTLTSTTNTKWKSSTQAKESNIDIITKLQDLYDCNIKKTEEYENFKKYEYTKPGSNNKTGYLYRKKDINKEINEVFNVYELTNTIIGIEYNKNKKKDEIGIFYEISLIDLNVDLIQLAINTNSLSILKDPNDNNSYLGFTNNFPALVYNNDRTAFAYTSREQAKWTNVYEDNNFETIDTFLISIKNDKYPHPSHTPEFADQNKITNQDLYMKMYTEIKQRIVTGSDIKDILSQDIFRMRVKVECENDESLADLAKMDFIISQNISWVLKNALWLEKYLEIRTVNNSLTAQQLKSQIGEQYECDLSDLDEKYIIVDEKTIDGINYVICGYPEKKMKEIILNFWQEGADKMNDTDINFCNELKNLHELKETLKLLIDFYNKYNDDKIVGDNNELWKYFHRIEPTFNDIKTKFDNFYELNSNLKDTKQYEMFNKFYLKNAQTYYNEIANNYLKKMMTTIKYNFFIFIELNGNLIPMIFNIKELENKHIQILERINKLIRNELPYKFGIIEENKYNPISSYNDKEKYNLNNEYKLFYSSVKYGNIFYINTEYIHMMGNIYKKDYEYKQIITLEEIIYSCSIYTDNIQRLPYWKAVNINYKVREYNDLTFPIPSKKTNSRTDIVFNLYEKTKIDNKQHTNKVKTMLNSPSSNNQLENLQINIIMIYKINIQKYTIIFKYIDSDDIYILEIESCIIKMINKIIEKLDNNIILNKIKKNITFNYDNHCFKIISNTKMIYEDFKNIISYNPIILYNINQDKIKNSINKEIYQKQLNNQIPKNKKINNLTENNMNKVLYEFKKTRYDIVDTSIYYMNALLISNNKSNISYLININNVELYKIYSNVTKLFLENGYYDKTKNNNNFNLMCQDRLEYKTLGNINCIHYNYNKCGYDFIETIDNLKHKIVIYILPHKLDTKFQTHKYLSNITDLDKTSILMINSLYNLYSNNNTLLFIHIILNLFFNCIHFHIIKTDNYNREKSFTKKGTYIIQDIYIKDIIKNLNIDSNYYIKSNYTIIKAQ
jgi:hypothetical protein